MPIELDRRRLLGSPISTAIASAAFAMPARAAGVAPRTRVILDNDFAGDPDGLFQLAHHLLCPSIQIPLIIGSHLPAGFGSGHDARDSAQRAAELKALMPRSSAPQPVAGAETPIPSRRNWRPSPVSAAIVHEAMRSDGVGPLVYASGAGLTDLALAWLSEPRIGRRLRLVWIGGRTPPGVPDRRDEPNEAEFNFSIDPLAAQIVFNESDIEIWQVPAGTYRQMLFSTAELQLLADSCRLGAWLKARVDAVPAMLARIPGVPPIAETDAYVLGDSPLVTLTALLSPFQPEPTSSRYALIPTPHLELDGSYHVSSTGRPMRVYTQVDAGLTFRDMLARFHLASANP